MITTLLAAAHCVFPFCCPHHCFNYHRFRWWCLQVSQESYRVLVAFEEPTPPPHSLLSHLWTASKFLLSRALLCPRTVRHLLFPLPIRLFLYGKCLFTGSSLVPQTHICRLSSTNSPLFTHFSHADTRGAKSFIKCSGCYDNYECSTCRYNKSLKKLSHRCAAPQLLCTVIVLEIFRGALFKKGCSIKDQKLL